MFSILSSIKSETLVGLLILGATGILIYSSIQVTGWKQDETDFYTVSVLLDNVTGLGQATAVRMSGVKIGEVTSIELENGKARVFMKIFKKYKVRNNSVAAIKSLGILGDKYISLSPGSQGLDPLEDGDNILLVQEGSDLDSLIDNLSVILSDLKSVTGSLNNTLGQGNGEERLNRIMANVETLTYEFGQTAIKTNERIDSILISIDQFTANINKITEDNRENLNNTLQNIALFTRDLKEITDSNKKNLEILIANISQISEQIKDDVPSITSNLSEVTETLNQDFPNIVNNINEFSNSLGEDGPQILMDLRETSSALSKDGPLITDNLRKVTDSLNSDLPPIVGNIRTILDEHSEDLKTTLSELSKASEKINGSFSNLESITAKINDGEGSIAKLVNDGKTVDKLNTAIDNLGKFLGDADKLKIDLDFHANYFERPDNYKYYLGVNLRPTRDHSILAQIISDQRGVSTTETTYRTEEEGNTTTERKITETKVKDTYRFSLQLTQRFYDTRLRAGLFESYFGLGVDQYFGINDDYSLNAEIFNFDRETDSPYMNVGGKWVFLGNFYLTAGFSDVFSKYDANRGIYLGFGMGFNEDKLKTLAVGAGSLSTLSN